MTNELVDSNQEWNWFSISYPNYPPAIFPRSPVPGQGVNPGIAVLDASLLKVWPNPSAESIGITRYPIERIDIARSNGQAVEFEFHNNRIEWRTSWKGMALVMVTLQDGRSVVKPICVHDASTCSVDDPHCSVGMVSSSVHGSCYCLMGG